MRAGDSVSVGPITLPNGTSYRGVAMRVDNVPQTDTDSERYYVVRVAGAAPAPLLGEEVRSSQAMVLRVRYYDFCCSAAIQVKDTLEQAGNSMISGNNLSPSAWAGQCDSANPANVAGAEVECDSCYSKGGVISQTYGNPPTESDTTLQSETLTEWDEVTYEFLKAKASKTYAAGEIISNTVPVVTTDPLTGLPVCDESVRRQLGRAYELAPPVLQLFPDHLRRGGSHDQREQVRSGVARRRGKPRDRRRLPVLRDRTREGSPRLAGYGNEDLRLGRRRGTGSGDRRG